MSLLISREDLAENRDAVTVLAVSPVGHGTHASAHADFAAAHLPGARLAYGAIFTRDPEEGEGRGPLPRPEALQESVRALGLALDDDIVLYDSFFGAWASRAWWVLTDAGFENVRILDGGLPYWQEGGFDVESGAVTPVRSDVVIETGGRLLSFDADQVAEHARTGLVIDARDARRFAGEAHPELDPRGGHIPGAVNLPWKESVAADGRFLPAAELRAKIEALGASDDALLVNYCGSGVSGAYNLVTQRIAGYPRTALYAGSWSEWAADPNRPVETVDA